MRQRIHVLILLPLLLAVGCDSKKDQKLPPPPIQVGVAEIRKGELEHALEISGTLRFLANTTVSAEVSAQINSIAVADGQFVQAGDLLLTFDETKIKQSASEAAAHLQRDEAILSFNKAEWEKNKGLHETGSISQTQYDQKVSAYQTSLAQVEADRASLAKALEDLTKTKVRAPVNGVVSKRFVEKGDWVSSGGRLFQISDYDRIYLESFLTDVDLGKLPLKMIREEGLECRVTIDPYPGTSYVGKLSYVQPVANDMRLFEIRIHLPNPEMNLLQGMVGRARIIYKVSPDVMVVPLTALLDELRNQSKNRVVLVDETGKARLTGIRIGVNNQESAEVLEGLKPGDKVVTRGKEVLRNDQPLKITDDER